MLAAVVGIITLVLNVIKIVSFTVENHIMEIIKKYFPDLNDQQLEKFSQLGELYQYWNQRINVISRKDIDELYERHVLHSLAISLTG